MAATINTVGQPMLRAAPGWSCRLSGDRLQISPDVDPHDYAFYFYTRPGDHIGWREKGAAVVAGSIRIPPGGLAFFDGDALRHRISPMQEGEMRVSLTFEYLTDPKIHPWWWLISNLKDAFAYFGFRQVFERLIRGRGE